MNWCVIYVVEDDKMIYCKLNAMVVVEHKWAVVFIYIFSVVFLTRIALDCVDLVFPSHHII